MEELIRVIVDADKKARSDVQKKQQEKNNVEDLILEKREEIKRHYREETQRCIAEKRAEMDKELAESVKQEEADYEKALAELQKQYEAHKKEWVDRIVRQCLQA